MKNHLGCRGFNGLLSPPHPAPDIDSAQSVSFTGALTHLFAGRPGVCAILKRSAARGQASSVALPCTQTAFTYHGLAPKCSGD